MIPLIQLRCFAPTFTMRLIGFRFVVIVRPSQMRRNTGLSTSSPPQVLHPIRPSLIVSGPIVTLIPQNPAAPIMVPTGRSFARYVVLRVCFILNSMVIYKGKEILKLKKVNYFWKCLFTRGLFTDVQYTRYNLDHQTVPQHDKIYFDLWEAYFIGMYFSSKFNTN